MTGDKQMTFCRVLDTRYDVSFRGGIIYLFIFSCKIYLFFFSLSFFLLVGG